MLFVIGFYFVIFSKYFDFDIFGSLWTVAWIRGQRCFNWSIYAVKLLDAVIAASYGTDSHSIWRHALCANIMHVDKQTEWESPNFPNTEKDP